MALRHVINFFITVALSLVVVLLIWQWLGVPVSPSPVWGVFLGAAAGQLGFLIYEIKYHKE